MEKNFFESDSYLNAQKKWKENGYLGVTAEDHEGIHSTPNDQLVENPGKTLADIMSDQEILEYLQKTEENIAENKGIKKLEEYNSDLKKNLITTIQYLKKIGKLPESYQNYKSE